MKARTSPRIRELEQGLTWLKAAARWSNYDENSTSSEVAMSETTSQVDFDALDACHQQIQTNLRALTDLVKHVQTRGVDDHAKAMAATIEAFFSATARDHHAEEERTIFEDLLKSDKPEWIQTIRTLQQDHGWIEENWLVLGPQLEAMAQGNGWIDPQEFEHTAEVFLNLCEGHIALEESLVYPESKQRWAKAIAARLTRLPALSKN
jgi:hemerythrin-like domain-containing protein